MWFFCLIGASPLPLDMGYLFWWDPTFSCWWLFGNELQFWSSLFFGTLYYGYQPFICDISYKLSPSFLFFRKLCFHDFFLSYKSFVYTVSDISVFSHFFSEFLVIVMKDFSACSYRGSLFNFPLILIFIWYYNFYLDIWSIWSLWHEKWIQLYLFLLSYPVTSIPH